MKKNEGKTISCIIIGDFGKDLDDEHTLAMAAGLQRAGFIELLAVVGNLGPAEGRAAIAKGTLKQVGLGHVPVGIGTPVFSGSKAFPYETDIPYVADSSELVRSGEELIVETLSQVEDNSVTLVLQSGMTDAMCLLLRHEELCVQKVAQVAMMAGVQQTGGSVALTGKFIQPDDSSNVTFDWSSGAWLYARLQELGIPMVITTRHAAYACQLPFRVYDDMEQTGNPVGICLKARQQHSMEHLWKAACAPEGAEIRGTLPPRCNRSWFVNVFCAGKDPGDVDEIWPHTDRFNLYDPMNLLVAIPEIRNRFFNPKAITVLDTEHVIVGVSAENHGIAAESALREFMVEMEISGLS